MTKSIDIKSIANKYAAFLDAGTSYKDALSEAAKALGDTPCITLLEALAKVHAAKYKCNYTWSAKGSAVFYEGAESTRESRNGGAFQSWRRNVMVHFETASKSSNKTVPTKVSKAVILSLQAALAGLTPKECAAACKAALDGLSFVSADE